VLVLVLVLVLVGVGEGKSNYEDVDEDLGNVGDGGDEKVLDEDGVEKRRNVRFHVAMMFSCLFMAIVYTDWETEIDGVKHVREVDGINGRILCVCLLRFSCMLGHWRSLLFVLIGLGMMMRMSE